MTALLLQPIPYGAKELQNAIRLNTYKSLLYAITGIMLLCLCVWLLRAKDIPHPKPIPGTIPWITQPPQETGKKGQDIKQPGQPPAQGGQQRGARSIPVAQVDTVEQEPFKDPGQEPTGTTFPVDGGKEPTGDGGPNTVSTGKEGKGTGEQTDTEPPYDTIVDELPQCDIAQLMRNAQYPERARQMGLEAIVHVKALVAANGSIQQTQVEYSENSLFNNAALDAVKLTHFSPAKQGGQNVACWIVIPIHFKLH